MKLLIPKGKTSKSIVVFLGDSSVTTGVGLSGKIYSDITSYYFRPGAASSTSITMATLAAVNTAYSSGGFKEIDATNMKGFYRFDLPDAAIASGVDEVYVAMTCTGGVPINIEIQLTGADFGIAPGTANGLLVAGSNAATTFTSASGSGLTITSTGSNGSGLTISGNGSGHGVISTGGATGD